MATKDDSAAVKTGAATPAPAVGEGRWARWGRAGFDKSIKISDWISPYANSVSASVGGERFWPQSNDMKLEIEKCERILRAFTVEGIQQKDAKEEQVKDAKGNWIKKKVRVLRKIPPAAIRNAKGIAIYSSMRSGIAPLGGGGGSGLFMARLPDGSWSAPSAISPQNGAVGLLLGVDFLDVILLVNSEKSMETFKSHRVDVGAETGVAAGPYGTGYSAEASYDKAPIYSYVRTRGMYAGAEVLAQVFLHRFDENERFYYWPGIKAGDILTGKIRVPPVVYPLHRALRDAETGRAQGGKLERTEYDLIKIPESEVFRHLGPNSSPAKQKRFVAGLSSSNISTPHTEKTEGVEGEERESLEELDLEEAAKNAQRQRDEEADEEIVRDGERLRLPPTPAELEMMEAAGIPDDEDIRVEREDRLRIYALPAPPMHPDIVRHWGVHHELGAKRPRKPLVMDGPNCPEVREAQYVRLPPSPKESPLLQPKNALPPVVDRHGQTDQKLDTLNGEVLAKGVEEAEADQVMKAALHDQTDEAKRIGKEASEAAKEEHIYSEHDEISDEREVLTVEDPTEELREGKEDRVVADEVELSPHDAEQEKAETYISNSVGTSSPKGSFASLDTAPQTEDLDSTHASTDAHVELPETTSLDALHTPALRADTPTNETDITGPLTPPPAGDETAAEQSESGKLTPSRPPRRKRPPKKN